MSFKKAERKQVKLKIGLAGPSGSGKTYSALLLASGIAKPRINGQGGIAVIDTENNSASLYADRFEFDVNEIEAPYTTDKYLVAMREAQEELYDVVIVDSLSHQWAGEGGILNEKEKLDSRGGNSFANWAKMTPVHEKFKNAILQLEAHTICTVRSKQDYVVTENDKGKQAPKKVGMAPVQREGLEYELSVVFDLAMDHSAQTSKDRTGLFDKQTFTITEETGKNLMLWLASGKFCWRFGERERSELRTLMKSFAGGVEVVREDEKIFGAVAQHMDEGRFVSLCYKLREAEKASKADPQSFDNFSGAAHE